MACEYSPSARITGANMHFFTKPRLICWLLLTGIAAALFISYMIKPQYKRVILYFPHSSGSVRAEERYIPPSTESDFAASLVTELLLGSVHHTAERFTDPEIRPRSCFVRNRALYLDLPRQVLTPKVHTPDFHTFYTLLQKAITVNCKDIDTVYVYIDGVPVYQQS